MAGTIRVGIVGANPDRGWAVRAHVPALRALPGYQITAVGTTRTESAEAAARRFGARHAFTDARRLAEHPDVDLVLVAVKVPAHAELVGAALAAGKHVYCEWPLALDTAEATELAAAAEATGLADSARATVPADGAVRAVVGLQARYAPALRYARDLLAAGHIGTPTSATVYSARPLRAGGQVPGWAAYTMDRRTGAGLLEVAGGHTLDAVERLLGPITEVSARLALRLREVTVAETGEPVTATSPDQLLLTAVAGEGVPVAVHIHDGKITDGRTRIEVAGTTGDLALVSTGAHRGDGVQISPLRLYGTDGSGGWTELPVPDRYRRAPAALADTEAEALTELYAALAEDVRTGARTVPDFAAGVRVHRLLDAVRESADTGTAGTP